MWCGRKKTAEGELRYLRRGCGGRFGGGRAEVAQFRFDPLLVRRIRNRPACLDALSLLTASNSMQDHVLALYASHAVNNVGQADDGPYDK
jgi:hypothetical protein